MEVTIKKISRSNLLKFIDILCRGFEVIAPVKIGGDIFFNPVKKSSELTLDYINPVESPKRFFFPQIELMYQMDFEKHEVMRDEAERKRKKLIFGIRSCDLAAINGVDKFFTGEKTDSYYRKLRQDTILVNLLCHECASECFCTAIPGGSLYCDGYDLRLSPLDDGYLAETGTTSGEELLKQNKSLFEKSGKNDIELREEAIKKLKKKIRSNHKFDKAVEKLKSEKVDSAEWSDIAKSCQDCGGCCYVCPVCTCYNIIDDVEENSLTKYRFWDSCLFSGFSRMAMFHNPHKTFGERLEYRFMHRLKYFEDRYNSLGCTGCGRCDVVCLGDIGTGAVLKRIRCR
ncbi:MAG: hypothetical protein A2149_05495 [Candidatus Schekmanbacteria bacterium RBG_16_38_11]|uniref:4Fe-4S ferredoxin-type domain-containing protein n=1 Tax=Candidatus Schekmanbacteria bacterium RBG_16_38_11 TaxID=1817880 RepID=A0A1F7RYK8_9BACT|nr:MAG: hypothetical protein A2149_05495 [Candidatus Schekmanbacteria bacterium RBG_16_38_11]